MSGHAAAPEVWVLVAVNFFEFFLGLVMMGVSFLAYWRNGRKPALRNATAGFGLLTLGTVVEPVYQLGFVGTTVLASDRNVVLQIAEGALISLGFLVLFFSIYRYRSRSERRTIPISGVDDGLFE